MEMRAVYMQKLSVRFENCFGIKKLEKKFDFRGSKVNAIYAKNGLMKTSFSKTFKMIQINKDNDIRDEIFDAKPVIVEAMIDDSNIKKEEVFVIKSFENSYESTSIASLLLNEDLKRSLDIVLRLRENFLKKMEVRSGLKVTRTSLGKKVFELEPRIIKDFAFDEKSFLLNVDKINIESLDYEFKDIKYSTIFDSSVIKKIESDKFQEKIKEFLAKSDEIYAEYNFLDKGKFTLPKLKDIENGLKKNSFFVKDNRILLGKDIEIINLEELSTKIKEVERQLQQTSEFKEIEKLLSDAKGMVLKDIIENNPEIVEELELTNLDAFRKKLWLSYIKSEEMQFEELKIHYKQLEEKIQNTELDQTPWKEALNIFEKRFSVPFKMEISNLKSSIIGENLPKILFAFCKDGNPNNLDENNWNRLNRDELEDKDTLSQGERRALYLLNIIFDIEKRRRDNQKTLFIIDDIADSFDYKNKYAIVEYLREISEENNFFMIILSHNFDFYRLIASRLNLKRENRFNASISETGIILEQELYQNQPFGVWKSNLNEKNIIALIPLVRNLIEYGVDKKINDLNGIDEDYLFLTNILHIKENTEDITFGMLKKVYKEYIGKDNFEQCITDTCTVYQSIARVADSILDSDTSLENKIVLAISIRLNAEKFMKESIQNSTATFSWKNGRASVTGDKTAFLNAISMKGTQTRELFNGYVQIGDQASINILESVNIMTPESIHLNSFMYEPILDMDIIELKNLYSEVKGLQLQTI